MYKLKNSRRTEKKYTKRLPFFLLQSWRQFRANRRNERTCWNRYRFKNRLLNHRPIIMRITKQIRADQFFFNKRHNIAHHITQRFSEFHGVIFPAHKRTQAARFAISKKLCKCRFCKCKKCKNYFA